MEYMDSIVLLRGGSSLPPAFQTEQKINKQTHWMNWAEV